MQTRSEPIGPTFDRLRAVLDPLLGAPKRDQKAGRVNLVSRFRSEGPLSRPMRVKIEINSREHLCLLG